LIRIDSVARSFLYKVGKSIIVPMVHIANPNDLRLPGLCVRSISAVCPIEKDALEPSMDKRTIVQEWLESFSRVTPCLSCLSCSSFPPSYFFILLYLLDFMLDDEVENLLLARRKIQWWRSHPLLNILSFYLVNCYGFSLIDHA
jgi:hypothetical protein